MKGFKDFILRGNLIELAVAFIIGGAFAAVVESFTKVIIELLAKVGGAQNFDAWHPFGMTSVGPFLTALVSFLILALVVYFGIVKPYEGLKKRFEKPSDAPEAPSEAELLTQIRDLLASKNN